MHKVANGLSTIIAHAYILHHHCCCCSVVIIITSWQSNFNKAIKYRLKAQNEILTTSLVNSLWTTSATAQNYISQLLYDAKF